MRGLGKGLVRNGLARRVVLLLASGGALLGTHSFQELSLPSISDGAATGVFEFGRTIHAAGDTGVAGFLPAVVGLMFCLALLAGALYHEFLILFTDWRVAGWAYLLGRAAFIAVPLVVLVHVVAQWLAVFLSFLLLWFAVLLLFSALKRAR
jgi:hypothetical protein